jgi:hypothetical protein
MALSHWLLVPLPKYVRNLLQLVESQEPLDHLAYCSKLTGLLVIIVSVKYLLRNNIVRHPDTYICCDGLLARNMVFSYSLWCPL